MPFTLCEASQAELIVKKSRFIACVQPVADRPTALQVVSGLRQQHPDAAHVCWALMAGGHSAAVDDGEPSGTAGRPMLEVLRRQGLEGVLATVVRYFGGVKLGAGGLVGAYTDSVATALKTAQRIEIVKSVNLQLLAPYALEGTVRHYIQQFGATIASIEHKADVQFQLLVPEPVAAEFVQTLNNACQGRLHWLQPDDPDPEGPR